MEGRGKANWGTFGPGYQKLAIIARNSLEMFLVGPIRFGEYGIFFV